MDIALLAAIASAIAAIGSAIAAFKSNAVANAARLSIENSERRAAVWRIRDLASSVRAEYRDLEAHSDLTKVDLHTAMSLANIVGGSAHDEGIAAIETRVSSLRERCITYADFADGAGALDALPLDELARIQMNVGQVVRDLHLAALNLDLQHASIRERLRKQ